MSDGTFYITTPIYYPNGEPHLGHAYTTICADAVARFHRLAGNRTWLLTGTDQHGQKMDNTAKELGVEPAALADEMTAKFKDYFAEIGISNDDFIHTRQPRHVEAVTKMVEQLQANGDVYAGSYSGWYDEGEEAFVTETDAKANDYKSEVSGRPLVKYEEPTYFFKLGKYVPKLVEHIEANPSFIQPDSRRNKILQDLKDLDKVGDLSITRSSLKWGTPMPGDAGHVLYVWVDALPNYYTALDSDDKREAFWPADVHLIGKEILWFHTVYWPCILMSLGLPLPKQVYAHGWWTSEGRKMSKSLGNFVGLSELREVTERFGLDAVRYYMLRAAPFGSDLDWQRDELTRAYTELATVVGNGLNRVLTRTGKYREGVVPSRDGATPQDDELLAAAHALGDEVAEAWTELRLQDAVTLPVELARKMNAYIDQTEPFKLAKDESQSARLDAVLATATAALYQTLVALLPVLPSKAAAGLEQLGVEVAGRTFDDLRQSAPTAGHQLGAGSPLFPGLD
ncbi:MAG: methionine--tRNA ligase [Planctomycetota bacterium]